MNKIMLITENVTFMQFIFSKYLRFFPMTSNNTLKRFAVTV